MINVFVGLDIGHVLFLYIYKLVKGSRCPWERIICLRSLFLWLYPSFINCSCNFFFSDAGCFICTWICTALGHEYMPSGTCVRPVKQYWWQVTSYMHYIFFLQCGCVELLTIYILIISNFELVGFFFFCFQKSPLSHFDIYIYILFYCSKKLQVWKLSLIDVNAFFLPFFRKVNFHWNIIWKQYVWHLKKITNCLLLALNHMCRFTTPGVEQL